MKQGDRVFEADTSSRRQIRTQRQKAVLRVPSRTELGAGVVARARFVPARVGRPVRLQVRRGGSWVVAASRTQSSTGRVTFRLAADETGTTRYRVVARKHHGAAAVRSASRSVRVVDPTPPRDTQPPPVPDGLVATAADGSASLVWAAVSAGDLAGYRIYRSPSASGPWQRLTPVPIAGTTYGATELANGTEYWFAVAAVDEAGNESALSATASVTPQAPPDLEPPPAPAGASGAR